MIEGKVARRGVSVKFCCSECGGHAFGSFVPDEDRKKGHTDTEHMWRHCSNCPHTFSIADDYKNFIVNGYVLKSQEDFEDAVYTERSAPDADVRVCTITKETKIGLGRPT